MLCTVPTIYNRASTTPEVVEVYGNYNMAIDLEGGINPQVQAEEIALRVGAFTPPPPKKWYTSKDNEGWDDNVGWFLISAGSLGLAPGPTDAAAAPIGAGIARYFGWGARGAIFATGMMAYGLPLIAIGVGFVLTRLD